MPIKHPNLKLAVCLLAASLLSACGGSSSSGSSGGAGSGGSYDLGYAQGTAATLDLVLDDLQALQASLAGSGGPVQTSSLGRAVTISVSGLNLAPRQRADLAAQLSTFIARLRMTQEAAAGASAGRAEANAAQTAAMAALQALRLVVAADTATQSGAGSAAQEAAITALTQIAAVEPDAPDAAATINRALTTALEAAEAQVAQLERDLAAANAALGAQEGTQSTIATLTQQLNAARSDLTALRNARTARFGAPPTDTATVPRASTTYHPRRTGAMLVFDTVSDTSMPDARTTNAAAPGDTPALTDARVFNPTGPWGEATEYDVTDRGAAVTDGFDLTPDAVLFNPAGSNRRVFTASSPNTSHFPGRGTVYRGLLRYVDADSNPTGGNPGPRTWIYGTADRLVVQGLDAEPCSGNACESAGVTDGNGMSTATNAGSYNNWDAPASVTFQYKTSGGFTMGFGGEGVIFGDLERYAAKGGKSCGAGSDEYCDESTTTNVELSFGAPQADPYGQPSTNYWYVQTPSPRLPATAAPDLSVPGDRIANHDMGRYEMILSANAQKDDGADRRLAYAAYGLSRFLDFTTSSPRVGRMQTFHYGLDAFADADGRRATELTGNDKIEGTFHGKTAAWIVTSRAKAVQSGPGHFIANLFRARADIELRACIGDSNCTLGNFDGAGTLNANQVAGFIRNLEYAHQDLADFWVQDGTGGVRQASSGLRGTSGNEHRAGIRLNAAAIMPDGSYSGETNPQWIEGLRNGTYEGSFYGPVGTGMEAAGTWRVGMAIWQQDMDAIIGSFGAICEGDCQPAASP